MAIIGNYESMLSSFGSDLTDRTAFLAHAMNIYTHEGAILSQRLILFGTRITVSA